MRDVLFDIRGRVSSIGGVAATLEEPFQFSWHGKDFHKVGEKCFHSLGGGGDPFQCRVSNIIQNTTAGKLNTNTLGRKKGGVGGARKKKLQPGR